MCHFWGKCTFWQFNMLIIDQWYPDFILSTRYSVFNNTCCNNSIKSKLLWSYPVKPILIIKGDNYIDIWNVHILQIYKNSCYYNFLFCVTYITLLTIDLTLSSCFIQFHTLPYDRHPSIVSIGRFSHFIFSIPWRCK